MAERCPRQILPVTDYQYHKLSVRQCVLMNWLFKGMGDQQKSSVTVTAVLSGDRLERSKIQQHLKYSDQLDKTIKMVGLPVWPPCPIHVTSAVSQRYKDPLKGESGVKTYILPFMSPQCTTQSPPHPAAVFGNKHQWACKYKQLKTASVKMSWNNRRPLQPRVWNRNRAGKPALSEYMDLFLESCYLSLHHPFLGRVVDIYQRARHCSPEPTDIL